MPERSFGRTIRYRRTKLGLSQAKLAELVGRSTTTVRAWERDASTPTDASVLLALAAVLGLDARQLFERAGVEMPTREERQTLEEALASLGGGGDGRGSRPPDEEPDPARSAKDPDSELEEEVGEGESPPSPGGEEPEAGFEPFPLLTEPKPATAKMTMPPRPAYVAPPEPYQFTAPTPPLAEPSYLEDTGQRQLYRVRNLATLVIAVALVVVFLWSLENAFDALGAWWDSFVSQLRL